MTAADPWLPRLALALAIGLLVGVERGWQMRDEQAGSRVAGIRTFALLGLIGGLAGIGAGVGGQAILLAAILTVGATGALLLGYSVDMRRDGNVSATSTLAGMLTLGLGALATAGEMALASVGAGATVILLASREPLHRAIQATSAGDLKALLRLVLVVFIVLPLLPDATLGPFGTLNPFRLWTVVVITGSISFLGYFLSRWLGERRGALLAGAVGAVVSSTAVTVDAARGAREGISGLASGSAVAIASSIMLARSLILVGVLAPFAFASFAALVLPGLIVSTLSAALLLYNGRSHQSEAAARAARPPELGLALLFAATVAVLSVGAAWAQAHWGGESGAILIAIGGLADIDAAIAAVGSLPAGALAVQVAALALAGPTLFNTLFKLALFVVIGGWRRTLPGAIALGAVATALLIPMGIALL